MALAKKKSKVKHTPHRALAKVEKPIFQIPEPSDLSYEQILIGNIIDGKDNGKVGESAIALAAATSSLTPSLRKVSYNYGISVGRSVYKVFDGRKHYSWYGDTIQDLILFFDLVGYNYILYKILAEDLEIMIYRKPTAVLGCHIHSFDAGIISGFLGAARGSFVKITEVACCNSGSEYCKFTTVLVSENNASPKVEDVAKILSANLEENKIRPGYLMLNMDPLLGHEYTEQIGSIFGHIGTIAGAKFDGKISKKMLNEAANILDAAGFGRPEFELRPLKIEMVFDGAKAKKEFVDISIRFLSGLLGRYSGKLNPHLYPAKKNSYKVILKQ